jgi:hypothetical protein
MCLERASRQQAQSKGRPKETNHVKTRLLKAAVDSRKTRKQPQNKKTNQKEPTQTEPKAQATHVLAQSVN